jgi:hypothetical protein
LYYRTIKGGINMLVECNNIYCKYNVVRDWHEPEKLRCNKPDNVISLSLSIYSPEGNELICKSFEPKEN